MLHDWTHVNLCSKLAQAPPPWGNIFNNAEASRATLPILTVPAGMSKEVELLRAPRESRDGSLGFHPYGVISTTRPPLPFRLHTERPCPESGVHSGPERIGADSSA